MGMTRGAISKVVDKLEAKKWVARKTLAADSRGHSLFLTRQGSAHCRSCGPLLTAMTRGSSTASTPRKGGAGSVAEN
ncbi:MAG: MarR family winged helix-turn-helix transcriptional regulator [Bryobacterales bacterium]